MFACIIGESKLSPRERIHGNSCHSQDKGYYISQDRQDITHVTPILHKGAEFVVTLQRADSLHQHGSKFRDIKDSSKERKSVHLQNRPRYIYYSCPSLNMHAITFIPILLGAYTTATLIHTDFPHLLIPLKSTSPDTAFGTAPDATVSYSVRTLP